MEPEQEPATDATPPANPRRILALIALLVGLLLLGHWSGADQYLDRERIRGFMTELGAAGFALYLVAFTLGELVHIPGMLFMAAAVVAYGPIEGGAAGFVGAIVSFSAAFFLVRRVGGQPLGAIRWPIMRRVLGLIEKRPIAVVAALRLLFAFTPIVNYALAMSPVRFRHYVFGSAIGIGPWVLALALATEKMFELFGG